MKNTIITFPNSVRGFTLIELMITLAIVAILLAVAAPSFNDSIARSQLSSARDTLFGHIRLARSEAVKRRANVVICTSSNQTACQTSSAADWDDGWIAFVDDGAGTGIEKDKLLNGSEEVLATSQALGAGIAVLADDDAVNSADDVHYLPSGFLGAGSNVKFKFCKAGLADSRRININIAGRPKAERTTDCP